MPKATNPTTPSSQALQAHKNACLAKERVYLDPETGYWVMTSFYLLQRDTCCGNGCRHCPWSEDAQIMANRPDVPAYPFPEKS